MPAADGIFIFVVWYVQIFKISEKTIVILGNLLQILEQAISMNKPLWFLCIL